MLTSFGGGTTGLILCYVFYGHTIHVGKMVNTVMGSLVSYTAITFLCTSIEVKILQLLLLSTMPFPYLVHSDWVCVWVRGVPGHAGVGREEQPGRPLLHLPGPRCVWCLGNAGCGHLCQGGCYIRGVHIQPLQWYPAWWVLSDRGAGIAGDVIT